MQGRNSITGARASAALVTTMILAAGFSGIATAQAGSGVEVSIGSYTLAAGGTAVAPLRLSNVTTYGTVTVNLTFDPAVVHVTNFSNGNMGGSLTVNIQNGSGYVRINHFVSSDPGAGNYILGYFGLRGVGAEGSATTLRLEVEELADQNGNPLGNTVANGTASIPAPPPPPAPDLGIGTISPPSTVAVNRTANFTVSITNNGTAASTSATLRYSIAGANGTLSLPGMLPGSLLTRTIAWTPTFEQRGEQTLRLQLQDITPPQNTSATARDSAEQPVFVIHRALALRPEGPVARTTGPGATVTYSLCLANAGNVAEAATLAASSSVSGWNVTVSPAGTVFLPPDACRALLVNVTPPSSAVASPVLQTTTLTATSTHDATATVTLRFNTTVENRPVVRSVELSRPSPVPAGEHGVLVHFSKPMDTSANVSVAYGPAGGNLTLAVPGSFVNATAWSGSVAFAPGADGSYLFNVTGGRDATGLALAPFVGGGFRVDTVAPVTTDDAPAAWANRTVRVTLNATDASETTTRYTLDGSTPNATSPVGRFVDIFANGNHTLRYYSVDAAGNAEAAKTAANPVRIDRLAPLVTATPAGVQGANGWFVSNVTVTLAATDNLSGVAGVLFALGNGSMTLVNASEHALALSAQGVTLVRYAAVDIAGNVAPVQTLEVRLDTGAPSANATVTPTPGENGWSRGPVRVDFGAGDATSGLAALFFRLGASGAWTETAAPHATLNVTAEGEHVVLFYARDRAGLDSPLGNVSFRIDATPPVAAVLVSGPEGENGWHRGNVTVTLQGADNVSGLARLAYRLDDGNATNYTGPFQVAGDRVHQLSAVAFDVAGNVAAPVNRTIRIDQAAPRTLANVTGPLGPNGWRPGAVNVTLSSRDATSGVNATWYSVDNASLLRYNGTFQIAEDGVHALAFHATDVAGNAEAPTTITVRIDTARPSVAFNRTPPAAAPQFTNLTVELRADDANLAEVEAETVAPNGETRRVNATDLDRDGVYTATVGPFHLSGNWTLRGHARDQAGLRNATAAVVLAVTDGVPPSVGIVEPSGLFVGGNVTVRADANDTDGVALVQFYVEGILVANDTTAPYSFVWTTRDGPNGFRNVSATATDRAGNAQSATRAYFVANLPSITDVVTSPALNASAPSPAAGDTIVVNATILGTSAPFDATLRYRLNATGAAVNVTGDPIGDGRYTFNLGDHSAGFLAYEIFATDAAGLTARVNGTVTIFPRPDPTTYAGPVLENTNTIEHDWADITYAAYEQLGASIVFGMKMAGPLNHSAGALYIVDFDTNNDTIVDYNLTATYTAGATPIVWRTTFHNATTGATLVQPTVSVVTVSSLGIVAMVADSTQLAALLAPTDLRVSFRTVGSTDSTLSVALDVVKPVITVTPPGAATNAAAAVFTGTVVDASGVASATFHYSVNNGPYQTLTTAPAAGVYTWTVPAPAAGTLSYFVTATDAVGNTETTPPATLAVGDAVPPTASIAAIAPADQGAPVELRATGVSDDAVSFAWTFGDGTPGASGATVTHVYAEPGVYQVNLTVSDAFLNRVTQTATVTIRDALPPLVAIASPAAGAVVAATAGTIAGTASDAGGVAEVTVTTAEGGAPVAAAYDAATGAWTAAWDRTGLAGTTSVVVLRATARDGAGLAATTAATLVTVDGIAPTAAIAGPTTGVAGAPLAFTALGSADDLGVAGYAWSFGDGTGASDLAPTKTYAAAGTYTVTVTVTDRAGNTDAATQQVVVSAAPSSGGAPGGGGGSGGNGGGSGAGLPPVTTPVAKPAANATSGGAAAGLASVVQAQGLQLARNLTGLDLPKPFGAVNGTTFADPNGQLRQLRPASTLDGRALFVVATMNGTGAAFLFDAGTNSTIPVLNPVPAVDPPAPGPVNGTQVVTVRVAKGDWIYFEIDDPAPGEALVEIRAGDGRVIPADRIWRADGRIAVLDDPDTVYHVVLSSGGAPSVPTPTTDSEQQPCPPKCGGGGSDDLGTGAPTPATPGLPTPPSSKPTVEGSGAAAPTASKPRVPGFEAVALVAALGAALLVLRGRKD